MVVKRTVKGIRHGSRRVMEFHLIADHRIGQLPYVGRTAQSAYRAYVPRYLVVNLILFWLFYNQTTLLS